MTVIKLNGAPSTGARLALEPLAASLYANRSMRIMGVIELAHDERTEPGPDSSKEQVVKLRITQLEIAAGEQEEVLREAQRALYLHRTAGGTVTDQFEVELSDRTLELTVGRLHAVEAARMRTAFTHWQAYIRRVLAVDNISVSEMRHELDTVAAGLSAVLRAGWDDDGDDNSTK